MKPKRNSSLPKGGAAKKTSPFKEMFKGVTEATISAGRLGEGEHVLRIDMIGPDMTRQAKPMIRFSCTVLKSDSSSNYDGQEVSHVIVNSDYFDSEIKAAAVIILNQHPDDVTDEVALMLCNMDENGDQLPEDHEFFNYAKNIVVRAVSVERAAKDADNNGKPKTFVNTRFTESLSEEEVKDILGDSFSDYFTESDGDSPVVFFDPETEGE